jgi:predicted GNAT family acetyltransferase
MEFITEDGRIYKKDCEDKLIAEVTFPEISQGVVQIDHTFVDGALRGQGVAGELMEAAYKELKDSGRKAILICPYAVKWYEDHPDRNDIVQA